MSACVKCGKDLTGCDVVAKCVGCSSAYPYTDPVIRVPTDNVTPRYFTDRAQLTDNLTRSDWAPVLTCFDTNTCAENFNIIIKTSITNAQKQINHSSTRLLKIKPWISTDMIRSIRARDKLSKAVSRQPFNVHLRNYYRAFRDNLTKSLKKAKRDYYRAKIGEFNQNPKMFCKLVNEISGKSKSNDSFPLHKFLPGIPIVTPDLYKQAANDFNSFLQPLGKIWQVLLTRVGPQL